jgi:hypothetical protein
MFCLPIEISENANAQTIKLFRIMKILCALQIVLGIFMLFIDIMTGIWILFAALLFVVVIWMKNWCVAVMYIIFCLMDLFTSAVVVGNFFAGADFDGKGSIYGLLYMVKFPFFLLVIYYSFLTYRELKGLYIEGCDNGGINSYGTSEERRNLRSEPPPQPIEPFQGTGYRLG